MRIALGGNGIVALAEKAAIDSRPASGLAPAQVIGQAHISGHVADSSVAAHLPEIFANRSHAGRMIGIGDVLLGDQLGKAGEGGHDVVAARAVVHGADQGGAVHPAGGAGQVLADMDAGRAGGDGPKLAPNLGRGARLKIEHVLRGRPAVQEDKNDAPGPAAAVGGTGQGVRFRQRGQAEEAAQETEAAGLQRITAGDAVAETSRCAKD
jgi:hypothetical protein